MQCEYQKTQNSLLISEPLKKFQMEGGDVMCHRI
jgi:hypothetical protein